MNYLKNRYPFKLISNFFRIASRTSDAIQNVTEPKRNKSDTVLNTLSQNSSRESLKLKSKSSMTFQESQIKDKSEYKLSPASSNCSLPQSKTSSEHSLTRGYTSLDLRNDEVLHPRKRGNSLEKEMDKKLHKLQESFSNSSPNPSKETLGDENRLKRSYPWQNFNLNTISQEHLEPKRVARSHSNTSINSDYSMSSLSQKSSSHSLRAFNSSSSISLDGAPKGSLEDIKNQMPMFKSILKKSAYKLTTPKAVTFNNLSTIYGSSAKNEPKVCAKRDVEDDGGVVMRRHEPLREENSFVRLYYGKNNKTAI